MLKQTNVVKMVKKKKKNSKYTDVSFVSMRILAWYRWHSALNVTFQDEITFISTVSGWWHRAKKLP